MQNVRNSILFFLLLAAPALRAQDPEATRNYINTYKDIAIIEMKRSGVPAAIKLAQGILETIAGTSDLVLKSNNHFGIKCKDYWKGKSVIHDDDLRGECFRKYSSAIESYRDHSDFLKGSTRYASLFNLEPTDYEHWAYGLKRAGYATNPHYPQIIIKLIEDYHLQEYTLTALGKTPVKEEEIVKIPVEEPLKETIPVIAVVRKEEPAPAVIAESEKVIKNPFYPDGEFKINETRVVYATKGTSFLEIAGQYNVPLARVFEFNDMAQGEVVNKDQLIFLQRKRKTGNNEFHIVQPGESLHDIAQQEAIRLETLLEYNWLKNGTRPAIGEKLFLRTKAAAMPALAKKVTNALHPPPPASRAMNSLAGAINFTVQPKETIYSISKKYKVGIDDIVKWNQLNSYNLKMGQPLNIYK